MFNCKGDEMGAMKGNTGICVYLRQTETDELSQW